MEHRANKLDSRRLVWVLLFELHNETKSTVFERGVCRTDNDGIPSQREILAFDSHMDG